MTPAFIVARMRTLPPLLSRSERRLGLGVVIAAHLALLYCWNLSRPVTLPAAIDASNPVTWLRWTAPTPAKPVVLPLPQRTASPAPRSPATVSPDAAPSTPVQPIQAPQPSAPSAFDPFAAAAPASRSADDIVQQARRDVGKIDKNLRKEFREASIPARVDTPQTRLQRGFDAAAQAVPNHWYEAPKVIEMMDEGGYGRKIYKVIGAAGTYCFYAESNHAPDGLDVFQHGPNSKTATCPREK